MYPHERNVRAYAAARHARLLAAAHRHRALYHARPARAVDGIRGWTAASLRWLAARVEPRGGRLA